MSQMKLRRSNVVVDTAHRSANDRRQRGTSLWMDTNFRWYGSTQEKSGLVEKKQFLQTLPAFGDPTIRGDATVFNADV